MELNFKNYQQLSLLSSLSVLLGFLMGKSIQHRQYQSTDEILARVKQAFHREGNVEGAWINSQPDDYSQFALRTKVYRGGISRREDQQIVQYQFIADAKTGTILKIDRI